MIDNGIKAIFLKGFKCTCIRNEMQYKIKIRLFRVLSIFLLKKKTNAWASGFKISFRMLLLLKFQFAMFEIRPLIHFSRETFFFQVRLHFYFVDITPFLICYSLYSFIHVSYNKRKGQCIRFLPPPPKFVPP